jgi:FMN phosphatase YigB (HAD superfamily)
MKKFKVKPEEVFYADDQRENLVEAERMGIKTVFYEDFREFRDKFSCVV